MKLSTLFVFLVLMLFSVASQACSITASGRCGGDPCDDGQVCKKTDAVSCSCVSEDGADLTDIIMGQGLDVRQVVTGKLQPRETTTVYAGSNAATFKVELVGVLDPNANMVVLVDEQSAVTLTRQNRTVIVNGKRISLRNAGNKQQAFSAALVNAQ